MLDIYKLTNQIEYLYSQDRNEEARAFLDNLPKSVERYPFLKTTILSIITKLIQRIWQNRATEFQLK